MYTYQVAKKSETQQSPNFVYSSCFFVFPLLLVVAVPSSRAKVRARTIRRELINATEPYMSKLVYFGNKLTILVRKTVV